MIFENKLVHGTLKKRYKRFLADVRLDNGEIITAHCTNSGSMKSCIEDGAEVYLTHVDDPKRKTKFTWEMIKINGDWVGINTMHPNRIVYDAVKALQFPGIGNYISVKREVKYGKNSRIDVLVEHEKSKTYIEVKNVTYKNGSYALFPDAVTTRGKKHLDELMDVVKSGDQAVMAFIIQRIDVDTFAPAKDIDPEYSKTLKRAYNAGVKIVPLQVHVSPEKIEIIKELSFELLLK